MLKHSHTHTRKDGAGGFVGFYLLVFLSFTVLNESLLVLITKM